MNDRKLTALTACLIAVTAWTGGASLYAQTDGQTEPDMKVTPKVTPTQQEAEPDMTYETMPDTPVSTANVKAGVARLLAENENYQSGDLLTWEIVEPVLARLRRSRVPCRRKKNFVPGF